MTLEESNFKIVIIGAGVAGLFAARTLVESGRYGPEDIVILEGQDYVGGRVCTVALNGVPLELGAQWIHGRTGNPLWEFVQENNIKISEKTNPDGEGQFVSESGQFPPTKLLNETLSFLDEISDDIKSFADSSENRLISVGEYYERRFKDWLRGFESRESEEDINWRKRIFFWLILWEKCDIGCDDFYQSSISSYSRYEVYDGGDASFANGYNSFIQALKDKLKGKLRIQLNTEVIKVQKDDAKRKLSIYCSDGSIYTCETSIITVSLGILKTKPGIFDPESIQLPPLVSRAIDKLVFGNIARIKLEFEKRFWDDTNPGIMILRDALGSEEDSPWSNYIYGFDSVFNHPNVLMGWISGYPSREMESFSDKEIGDECVRILKKATSSFKSNIEIKLKTVVVTRWFSNKFFKGTYSSSTLDCDRKGILNSDLDAPVLYPCGKPAILLAGEANDVGHAGTVHGAVGSGINQANHLIKMTAGSFSAN